MINGEGYYMAETENYHIWKAKWRPPGSWHLTSDNHQGDFPGVVTDAWYQVCGWFVCDNWLIFVVYKRNHNHFYLLMELVWHPKFQIPNPIIAIHIKIPGCRILLQILTSVDVVHMYSNPGYPCIIFRTRWLQVNKRRVRKTITH